MNSDCIFNILLYLNKNIIAKLLNLSKSLYIKNIKNNSYFWKLLCERDYSELTARFDDDYYLIYEKCCGIDKCNNILKKQHMYCPYNDTLIQLYDRDSLDIFHIQKEFISEIKYLQNLRYLVIVNLLSNEIPIELSYLSNLHELNLSDNSISIIPDELYSLKNLAELNLENNCIKYISDKIEKLENLENLNLKNNLLKKIPSEIGNLSKLEYLNLSNNKRLKLLPTELGKLDKLNILNLDYNKNILIPRDIGVPRKRLDVNKMDPMTYNYLVYSEISELIKNKHILRLTFWENN